MPVKVIRFPEGRYEGNVNETGDPEGEGSLEFPGNDEMKRQIYEGNFKAKKAHGFGIMRWHEGDKYEGEWKDGLRCGKGYYFSKQDNAKYEGEYKDDLKNGHGKYTYANGDIYEGSWENSLRHGKGVYKYRDAEAAGNEDPGAGTYEGDWVNGVKCGQGVYTYVSGDVFEGTYESNERNGEGTLTKVDGEVRSELWKEGKLVSFKVIKEGKKK